MPSPRLLLAIAATLAGVAVTAALGNWQLRRAAEKIAIEQAWDGARRAAPMDLRSASDLVAAAEQLPRRIRVRGAFEHARTIWLDNRALDGRAGFLVVTPFLLQGAQQRILVNRGWAPRDPAERTHLPPIGQPEGVVEIEGMAVAGVPRVFEFDKNEGGLIRQNLDLERAQAEIGAPVAGFVLQQLSPLDDALDRHWVSPSAGVDRNRGYAVQWFSLAALLAVIAIGLGWRAVRGRAAVEGAP
jgi:surfeit locus 1 family protein